jgi:hypothetical protein
MTTYRFISLSNGDWALMKQTPTTDPNDLRYTSIWSSISQKESAMLFATAMNLHGEGSHTMHLIQAVDDDDARRQTEAILAGR